MPKRTPEELAQGQLESYNARDIDTFCSYFAQDVQVFDAHSKELLFSGMDAFRERYISTFSNPKLHCTLVNRMVQGNIVIDQELVEGFGEEYKNAIAIYHIHNDIISEVHFY